MWYNDDLNDFGASHEKKIKFFRNGDSTVSFDYLLKANVPQEDLKKDITEKMKLKDVKNLRFFNVNGVEIFPEDFEYIKSNDVLYVSKGEDYDQNSSFSEYEIIKTLGEGGFGKVVLGVHRTSKEKVAIKFINPSAMEANMLKAMHHKNIVKIHNCFTLKNMQIAFVMEYLDGGELFEYVQEKGPLSEEEAKIFFRQLAEAVHYCHKEKLIHRDLKLENILLVDRNTKNIKVVDFGVAGLNTVNAQNAEAGSLKYMPPEAFNGTSKTSVHPGTDVWAMGCILYGLLFGDLPFNGKNNKEIIEKICDGRYKFPEKANTLSKEVKDLIGKLLTKNVEERVTMVDVINHPWVNPYSDK